MRRTPDPSNRARNMLVLGLWLMSVALWACTAKTGSTVDTSGTDDTAQATDDTGSTDTDTETDDTAAIECTEDANLELYDRYIEPLMTDAHPSTCNQCHLSGVDLSMYIQDTPCQSMACMKELGVVDLDDPEASQVLEFILEADPQSDLITQEVIEQEYDGFLEWIEWSATCHEEVCGEVEDACSSGVADNPLDENVRTPLGGCDEDALVESFTEKVWEHHGRCWSCHYVTGAYHSEYEDASTFFEWTGDNEESSRLTMYNLIGIGAIDLEEPQDSTLMTKPLAEGVEVSTDMGNITGVWHGGSDKFADGEDETLRDFWQWILTYTDCRE